METEMELQSSIESGDVAPVEDKAPVVKRKIAHMHNADKRANQRGPVWETMDEPMGRQTKEPCYEMVYHIHNPGGFKINEKLYQGRVVVPECVGNYLCTMDREWMKAERNLFRNTPTALNYDVGR